jgi:hypothetical protein
MKAVAYPLAAVVGFFGLMFIASGSYQQNGTMRIVVGVVLFAAAIALVWIALQKPKPIETTLIQKIDLSGDVSLEEMKCRSCGGTLGKESVSVKAGGIFINCQYCGTAYQIEEAPKW